MSGTRYYGKYRATVINNIDPENRGRVQVELAASYGLFPSTYALPAFPVAAIQHGVVMIPPLGASVWLEFEAGDPGFPIWSGAFFENSGEMPSRAAAGLPISPNIVLQTVGQVTLMLSDNPTSNVLIKGFGPLGPEISISPEGITISSGMGASIELKGPNVIINKGALKIT